MDVFVDSRVVIGCAVHLVLTENLWFIVEEDYYAIMTAAWRPCEPDFYLQQPQGWLLCGLGGKGGHPAHRRVLAVNRALWRGYDPRMALDYRDKSGSRTAGW